MPELTFEGTSGTYFLKNRDKRPLCVFKPVDEEAFAPNNPRNLVGPFGSPSLRKGVLSGEGSIREVAAYMIDHEKFSGVSETLLATIHHPSFQYCIIKHNEKLNSRRGNEWY